MIARLGELLAILAPAVLCLACGARAPEYDRSVVMKSLQVAIVVPPALRGCELAVGDRDISIPLGDSGIEQMRSALKDVFELSDDKRADLIATLQIRRAQARRRRASSVTAAIEYGLDFRTSSGKEVTQVTGAGAASLDYPVLVDLFRLAFHLGTLFLFERIDARRMYGAAIRDAGSEASKSLEIALRESPDIYAYATGDRGRIGGNRAPESLDGLIDRVLHGRPAAVAVLDLEPLVGRSTAVESYLGEELRTRLARRRGVTTFERAFLTRALEELRLNMTDLVDPFHARRFGRFVAADSILTGTTSKFPSGVKVSLRLLDTETGKVVGAASGLIDPGLPGRTKAAAPAAAACPMFH